MTFLPLPVEPGVYRNGTERQSAGRWYDLHLARWIAGALRPVGGWRPKAHDGEAPQPFAGAARALFCWADNLGNPFAATGTHTGLFASTSDGRRADITPADFRAGREDAGLEDGYGGGFFGSGSYGEVRFADDHGEALPASVWTLDAFGEDLVGCMGGDGKIYRWRRDLATAAETVEGAPERCSGLVVTQDGFLVALGAGGVGRRIKHSDQRSFVFETSDLNQAREIDLQTGGRFVCGKALKGMTLLFTDQDVWAMRFIGYPLVHGYERLAGDCGLIARGAVVADGQRAMWMAAGKFFFFDGLSVQPLACDVEDYLFGAGGLNRSQASKVTGFLNSDFGEAWWFYPRGEAVENSHYVFFDFRNGRWGFGALARTCAAPKGVFAHPLMVAPDGLIYEHEVGFAYPGADPPLPFAETGPIETGQGDRMLELQGFLPDEQDVGRVCLTVQAKSFPNAEETSFGPFFSKSDGTPTPFLLQGRQVRLRFTATAEADFRVGQGRLQLAPGDAY